MEGRSDGNGTMEGGGTPGTEDKTPPIRGIGLRVTNIEGNNMFPRRGIYSTNNHSVLDGLLEISKPVELNTACGGINVAEMNASHANPSGVSNLNPSGVFGSSTADMDVLGDQLGVQGSQNVRRGPGKTPVSYADSIGASSARKVNFRTLASLVEQEGCDVVLPKESVRVVKDKLANTLYGYFLGDRVAYPVVEYFVRNNWKKFGLQKSMMNASGFFFFKFADENGMMNAMKGGPWIIRSQPLFLNVWSPSSKLEKKEVKSVQLWVKIHEVPLAAYTEDGLSMIATAIGKPIALDSYTTSMCLDSWGRSSFARALVEISADNEYKEVIVIAVPDLEGDGFVKEKMYVEYEWCPHRCSLCKVFGHNDGDCPKQVTQVTKAPANIPKAHKAPNSKGNSKKPVVDKDGFRDVEARKAAKRTGFPVNKQKQRFEYRPVGLKTSGEPNKSAPSSSFFSRNPFDVLNDPSNDHEAGGSGQGDTKDDLDDDEVQEIYNETDEFLVNDASKPVTKQGASTPFSAVNNESHVDVSRLSQVCRSVFRSWDWTSNGARCSKGTRIIIGWNPAVFDVMVLSQTDQVVHLQLFFKKDNKVAFCSVVYAANYYVTRRELWHHLSMHKSFVGNNPWVIMGDFNSALNLEDKSMGASSVTRSMIEFQECVDDLEMLDINRTGLHFTWSQKPKKGIGLLKKIDRVLGNTSFVTNFPNAVAFFQPYRLSDHCPCVLKLPDADILKHRSFKFANFLVFKPEFGDIVKRVWDTRINGVHQFRVVKRLRLLKKPLRALLFKQGNLHKKVEALREKLDVIQNSIDKHPDSESLRVEETTLSAEYKEALLDEERFLKQKSKVDWLRAGDMNTAFFHSSLKSKNHQSRIDVIRDTGGVIHEGNQVYQAVVDHYEKFLGCRGDTSLIPAPDLFTNVLDPNIASYMCRQVTEDEVKKAMFSIGIDKAPGPDGFTAAFFKSAWHIVGNDVSRAIIDFFDTGNLLRELNHTLIVLVPKVPSPSVVTDFRPIACCNVIYKCITKILAERVKRALNNIVSINQSAFVPGRKISDNILLTQELMHNYHRNSGPPRCAFKVDIQKAYDTVDWKFLKNILLGFGFNNKMVNWIMVCVSTVSYSVCVNGNVHGYFKGSRGLRQGDPLSPYLFTLVMEVLTGILHHMIRIDSSFKFHNKCEKQQIINLCFADDLFLFARGEIASARCIMKSLTDFSKMSGLVPSIQKSTVFFCNVPSYIKNAILNIMPFKEGSLPVRYLGVPLISSGLVYKDCSVLMESLDKRIKHWRNKLLSFAGRLQLIVSVLSSMHIFWSSVFLLPNRVIHELEAKMRNFLWSQDVAFHRGKAKVSWKVVCLPKYEGGLGIRRLGDVNKALMTKHIWSIITNRNSLWVEWVHSYRLRGKNFWISKVVSNSCYSWRKLLQLRPQMRQFFWSDIGDGTRTSAWYDTWCELGPLGNFIVPRTIANAGFRLEDSVSQIQLNGEWKWPVAWRDLFPVLNQLDQVHIMPNKLDRVMWRDGNEKTDFSTSCVWDSIRYKETEVVWSTIVWFAQCIPRHAFLMWLIMRGKLLTQDKILKWDLSRRKNMNMMCCLLCYANHDSHSHLFFECNYSTKVWAIVKRKVGMDSVQPKWADIVDWLITRSKSKLAKDYVARVVVAATAYTIWQERNARIFKNQLRPPETVGAHIIQLVRYKLMGARLKNTGNVRRLLSEWDVHGKELLDDGG
ncbi:uncharacterized protein LOC110891242 [Helianthus annuus]|uniref:uncharacterized protein LOC110891242 n=1 Tax=Helianthus annuus TaxID=4232 RepID=UPI000B8F3A2E|nr:uncharacterized protein LOC110891242 [Helianthus annuus]